MDSRAKQRLTGAVILVALFVLLVPELLRGPRETHPSSDKPDEGMREYTIDVDEQNRSAQPVTTPAEPQPAPAPTPPASRASTLALPGEAATRESASAPPATNPMAAAPTPGNVTPSAPVSPTPAPAPAPATTPAAHTEPRLNAANSHAEHGSFVVQLGSFGSRDNADRLVRDMTAKGFTAFVAPIKSNGRELYRVRVGPTRDRASAEALAAELKRIGQSGSIVPIS